MNPLLEISFRVPFDQIQAAEVEPAIDELLADAAGGWRKPSRARSRCTRSIP